MKKLMKKFFESNVWQAYCENVITMYANGLAHRVQ